nr:MULTISPECIES: hypothetical protein [unclassified Streptomyces]
MRATASAFDAQRGKLPVLDDPHRSPEPIAVCRQISELGKLITDLSDEVLFRVGADDTAAHTPRVVTAFASAIEPACEAAAALGAVSHQLALLQQAWPYRHKPDTRDAHDTAIHAVKDALTAAEGALWDAASPLHAASAAIAPPSIRLQAARSRSTTTAPGPGPLPPASPSMPLAPSGRAVRGR